MSPKKYPADVLVERLHAGGLTPLLHNLPAGEWSSGERGIACHPTRVGEFRDGVGNASEYATAQWRRPGTKLNVMVKWPTHDPLWVGSPAMCSRHV